MAFVVGTYLFYYGTLRHTLMLQLHAGSLGRTVKPYNDFSVIERPAEFLCPILPPLVSTHSCRGVGSAGMGSLYLRVYPLVKQMARIGAFWMNRKPAS